MRTRLTRTARRMTPRVAIFAVVLALVSVNAASASPNHRLSGGTTYDFVGNVFDPVKGLLVWEGPITGDFDGCIQWWSTEEPTSTGQASHYDNVWEIWDESETCDGTLLLTGTESGTTTVRHFKNSIWRANGVVTGPEGSELIGRRVHDGGTIDEWDFTGEMPAPVEGKGVFRVN